MKSLFPFFKRHLGWVGFLFLIALAVLTLSACDLFSPSTVTQTVVQTQNPQPTPAPTPTPAPSPTPGVSGPSDVDRVLLLVFGYDCAPGIPEPNHSAGIITPGCTEAALTATPKKKDGSDAQNHGSNITWTVEPAPDGVFSGQVYPDPNNTLFNRKVKAVDDNGIRRVGTSVKLTVKLTDPSGVVHEASKTISVQ